MSKEDAVFQALLRGERLTVLTCLQRYHTTCLTQRVSEWRREGVPIEDRTVEGGHYKEYWIGIAHG